MKDFYFPKEIEKFICNKPFSVDETGMSDSSVLIFDDAVLKIQKDSSLIKNEQTMMNWLENKVSVPKCICNII